MKSREIITEMPYLHPGEMPRKMLDGTIRWAAIEREYPNYIVRIVDVDNGFFPDENGQDIDYRGSDLIRADAWTTGSNFAGYNRVIVLTKR